MCHAQFLNLAGNKIGDAGITPLADACARGALPLLEKLSLDSNRIGDAGMVKFSEALGSGALAHLQVSSRLTALPPRLETWHARSPGLTVLFGVPCVPCAEI